MAPKQHHQRDVIIRCSETRFFPICFFLLIALVTSTSIAVIIVTSSSFGFFLRDPTKCEKLPFDGLVYVDQPPPRSSDKNNVTTNNEKTSSNQPIVSIFQNRTGESEDEEEVEEEKTDCGYFVTHNPFSIPQLGNQMFSYASFYGTWSKSAKRVGKTTFLQSPRLHEYARILPDAFEQLSLLPYRNYSDDWYEGRNFTILSERGAGGKYWREQLLENASCDGRNVMMEGFRQSFKYFSNIPDEEIRREFAFKASVKRRAGRLLDRTLAVDGKGGRRRPGRERRGYCVLVGVHLRRGDDFAHEIGKSFGFIMADEGYLKEAVRFFERIYFTHTAKLPQQHSKFWCLTFLIFGNDDEWNARVSKKLTSTSISNRNKYTRLIAVDNRNSSPAVDLCALSMCDHAIISTGTFGWWVGRISQYRYRNVQSGIRNARFQLL